MKKIQKKIGILSSLSYKNIVIDVYEANKLLTYILNYIVNIFKDTLTKKIIIILFSKTNWIIKLISIKFFLFIFKKFINGIIKLDYIN